MASKNFNQPAGWSQADQRSYAVFYDQHKCAKYPQGRPWWAVVERPAEGAAMPMPVGELQPQGWDAPWLPDAKYITASIGKATQGATMQEHRFRIDYGAMISDRRAAMKEYYDRAVLEAIGQGWQAPNFGDPIPYRLRAIVGIPPLSPKIPEAALAEDPWILGFSPDENEILARLLRNGTEELLTAEQSEKKVDRLTEMEQKLAEATAMMQAMAQREVEREGKLKAKMEKARAGKKKAPDPVPEPV
jgi:hypothetical protein